jgi:hypothetical protein
VPYAEKLPDPIFDAATLRRQYVDEIASPIVQEASTGFAWATQSIQYRYLQVLAGILREVLQSGPRNKCRNLLRLGHADGAVCYRAGRPESELGAFKFAPSSTPTPKSVDHFAA